MTSHDDFDRSLTAWLAANAPRSEPEPLLGQVLARTARTRRRPAWRIPERWIPMSTLTTRSAPLARAPWRGLAITAILVAALIGGAIIVAGSRQDQLPAPFGPAANGVLAFSSGGDVYVVDRLGGSARAVLDGADQDGSPLFSPDGSKMLVLRGADETDQTLVMANADGSDARPIATGIDRISWAEISPAADVVATLSEAAPSVITLIPTDGGPSTVIETGLQHVEGIIFRPPDGRQIAFEGLDAAGRKGIYLIGLDGSGLTRLDLDPGFESDDYYDENRSFYFEAPSWAPNGQRLAYHTLEPAPGSPAGPGFRIHVAEIDPSGGVVSDTGLEFDPFADDENAPAWLPTGDGIVFQTTDGSTHRLTTATIVPAVGSPVDLGVQAGDWANFAISPDGTTVLAFLQDPGNDEPSVASIDLTTGVIAPVVLGGTDLVWQRRAR